jgi:hypothetical protein
MAHWAEIDENNIVLRVVVGNNEDPDEGYQWLIDNLGGTWIKTSYNTRGNVHLLGGVPFRKNYASPGYIYDLEQDAFIPPKPDPIIVDGIVYDFILDKESFLWVEETPIEYKITPEENPFE